MTYNPKTYDLEKNIDIAIALDKALKHLNNSKEDSPSIRISSDNPFKLSMRFARYIKAFNEQVKSVEGVDEAKYNFLIFRHFKDFVRISSSKKEKIELINEQTGEKI